MKTNRDKAFSAYPEQLAQRWIHMKNRTGKTIVTLLAVLALLIGIMPFAGKRVDAAVTEVVFDSSTWEDEFFGGDSSFTDKDNLVTATVTGDVSFYEYDSCAEFSFFGPSSLSFEASEGNQFTSITVYLAESWMSCPANWEKVDFTWKWTKGGNKATIDVEERTLFRIRSITFVLEPADEPVLTEYPLWVGGNQVTSKNKDDILGDGGKAKYDPETKTLTLNNANITNTYKRNCIYANSLGGTLTISLIGSNRIGNKDALNGIDAMLTPTVITGDGNLTVSDVTNLGIMDEGSSITIKDTEVTVENCHFGIDGTYQFEIDNSKVTVTGGTEGISNDKISITDSKIDVTASYVGIFAVDNKISISGNSYVSADTTDSGAKAEKYAMVATKGFELDGVEIIEPEGGEIQPKTIGAQERYAVVDKDNNIAQKAVIAKTYLITFKNDDGTVLQEKKTPIYETPKYEGDTPTKPSDDEYEYTFKGWDKEITEVKGDATYTAVYDRTPIEKPTPTPTPVTPFSIPKTGIEGSSPSYHLISLLGVCMLTIFLAKKHN